MSIALHVPLSCKPVYNLTYVAQTHFQPLYVYCAKGPLHNVKWLEVGLGYIRPHLCCVAFVGMFSEYNCMAAGYLLELAI